MHCYLLPQPQISGLPKKILYIQQIFTETFEKIYRRFFIIISHRCPSGRPNDERGIRTPTFRLAWCEEGPGPDTFTYSIRLLSHVKSAYKHYQNITFTNKSVFFTCLVSSSVIFFNSNCIYVWLVCMRGIVRLLRMRQLISSISFALLPFLLSQLEKRNKKLIWFMDQMCTVL